MVSRGTGVGRKARSERREVISWLPRASSLLRPFVEARARRLWVEDVDYCERTHALRVRRDKP